MAKKIIDGKAIIPEGTTEIDRTFRNCTDLKSIEIPSSVTEINPWAFTGCTNLEKIEVSPENKVYDSREGCNAIIESKSNRLVRGCKNTKIPNSVTQIGGRAFENCAGLTSIEIPNSVTQIRYDAFRGCTGLKEVTYLGMVEDVADGCFSECPNLAKIKVPANTGDDYKEILYYCSDGDSSELIEEQPSV